MTSTQTIPKIVEFPIERSTSLRFASHADGITTLGFRSQKTGAPTSDYDFPDPDGQHFAALIAAERPGTFFRRALKDGQFPTHIAKRPAGQPAAPPAQTAIIIEMPGPDGAPAQTVVAEQTIDQPLEKVRTQALSLSERASKLKIEDDLGLAQAAEIGSALREMAKLITAKHEKSIKAAHAAHEAALETRNSDLRPITEAQKLLDERIVEYDEQRKQRAEAAARLQLEEDARRQREEDALRQQEYQRKLEEAKIAAEAARLEREKLIEAKLEEAEANGASPVEVEAIIAQAAEEPPSPVFVPPPPPAQVTQVRVPAPPPPKIVGLSIPKTWVGVVTDKASLAKWVVQHGDQYLALLDINQAKLNGLGRTTEGKLSIPGVTWARKANPRISR